LDAYVQEWWESEMEDIAMPESRDERIKQYFEVMGETNGIEFYSIEELMVNV